MVNGISEKGLSVNHKVEILNFPGGASDNSGIKEFHLGKRKLHLNKKENSTFAKNLLHHINRTA